MSTYALHFARISDLIAIERRLVRAFARDPSMLPRGYQHLYRYAINLAKIGWLRAPSGKDIPLGDALGPYRSWLREKLLQLIPRHFMPDASGLLALGPLVAIRTTAIRQALIERHINDFPASTLDDEISHKLLALALGGGGGSGLAHLGLFNLLHEMDLEPSYIIGSSMGALVGLIRAAKKRYDPVAALMSLPKKIDLRQLFKPFSGSSRFGFPGAIDMNLIPLARSIFRGLLGTGIPRFSELPIHYEVLATGVRRGMDFESELDSQFRKEGRLGLSPFRFRSKLGLFFKTVKQFASNPRLLTQIVFNDEPGTQNMMVAEALGFSCSVPGVLHFDLYEKNPSLEAILEDIFERHHLFRLTDGGVINNVPTRVAWNSIQKGKLGSRNVFIFGVDVFAPIPNRNAIFIPIQQVARAGVLANRPYSDFTRTIKAAPNPINLAPSYRHLKKIVQRSYSEFAEDRAFIRTMMAPIPRFEHWYHQLYLPGATYR